MRAALQEIDTWRGDNEFIIGESLSLADLHAYPMLRYFVETPEGEAMLLEFPRLRRWLQQMQQRPSVLATSFHPSGSADGF